MSFTWWVYPTRRFAIDGLRFAVKSKARGDGLHSTLQMLEVEQASDHTPIFGPEAVRNHGLSATLPDGRQLQVELGYIGLWTTGIVARLDGEIVHESHPGRTPAYPEKYRDAAAQSSSMADSLGKSAGGSAGSYQMGAFAPENRLPFAVDIATGLLFFIVAKLTDLQTAALVGVAVGFALVAYQRITKIDVTGGLALFGIVMLAISAGLAMVSADDEWIKMRGTITGLIAAGFFIIDGLLGGKYIGKGLARYMPYADIDRSRFAIGMGLLGAGMAGLNYAAAKMLSTDNWLFYTTFLDMPIVMLMVFVVIKFARPKQPT